MNICTSCAINKLFRIGRFIARYRVIYWSIFQISAVFAANDMGELFSYTVSATNKK